MPIGSGAHIRNLLGERGTRGVERDSKRDRIDDRGTRGLLAADGAAPLAQQAKRRLQRTPVGREGLDRVDAREAKV